MVNLNTYLNLIHQFLNNHLQINTVTIGDKKDLTGNRDIMYPLGNIEYIDKQIRGTEDVYRFEIVIADLWNEDDNYSAINDCNMIADDLVNYFENTERFEDLEVFNNVTIKPFEDSFGDRVAGVVFTVSLTGFRESCFNSIPLPLPVKNNSAFPYAFPLQLI